MSASNLQVQFWGIWSVTTLLVSLLGGGPNSTATALEQEQNSTDAQDNSFIPTRVTNGEFVTNPIAFPSFIYFPGISCGGVLISPNLVLTAGHCVNGEDLEGLFAVAGTTTNPQNGLSDTEPWQRRVAVRAQVYPKFDTMSLNFDMAVVQVCPFTLTHHVNVVRNFARTLNNVKLDSGVVVGYGVTSRITATDKGDSSKRYPNSPRLLQARQRIRDPWTCKRYYETYVNRNRKEQVKVRRDAQFIFPDQGTQICGIPLKRGQSQCKGDSGGPLYCESKKGRKCLCGIVSFAPACGDDGVPGIDTSFYRDDIFRWIRDQQRLARRQDYANACS